MGGHTASDLSDKFIWRQRNLAVEACPVIFLPCFQEGARRCVPWPRVAN